MAFNELPTGLTREMREGVCWITIDRPGRANALSLDMQTGIAECLRAEDRIEETAAVVITAIGKLFSAGGDLRELADVDARVLARRRREVLLTLLESMLLFGKPLVTAVNGPAIGGGCMVALLGDQVIAAEEARFELPEVAIASPAFLASAIAVHTGGPVFSNDLLLAGKSINAAAAAARGCISECVPAAQLQARAQELALQLARMHANAYRETKRWTLAPLLAQIRAACEESARVRAQQDIPTARI